MDEKFERTEDAVLAHIQHMFEEMESDMALSHQEKYALLEDSLEQATDSDELRVAFDQWYTEHAEDLDLELEAEELWMQAVADDDGDDEEEW